MKLTAYVIDDKNLIIRPAEQEREWMDSTNQRYAYRCLPLNIANAHGWELACTSGFNAVWNGAPGLDAISILPDPGATAPPVSHFGYGILTFHIPCLFRTDAGFDLMVQGPINRPKDAIAPLSGVVEADWAPFTFTMNWKFTRPGITIRFEKDEPYCHIFPIRRGELEGVEPRLGVLSENPDLKQQYETWTASRNTFNADLKRSGSEAQVQKWQKQYYHGLDSTGQKVVTDNHRTRIKLKPFKGRIT